jgi:outer membrane protein OmpA-like peptidoglycan-associated protein/opacity protein-like surface antigen
MTSARSLLAGLGLCALAAAGAHAQTVPPSWQGQTRGFYLGIGGGWSHLMPFTDGSSDTTDGLLFHTKLQEGFVADLDAGYNFGRLRLEAEVAYRRADVRRTTIDHGGTGFPGLTGLSTANGDVSALSWMGNAMVDILPRSRATPYIGVGIGGVMLQLENYSAGGTTFVNGSDVEVAYQGIAGIRYQVAPSVSLALDYRFFSTTTASLHDTKGGGFSVPYRSHNVILGIAYHFGAPSPPPPMSAPIAAPAPVPPLPAPPPAPPLRNFIVYFNFDKSDLTPDARKTVQDAAATFKQSGSARIAIDGYTDLAGSALYNLKLSKRRADTVHAYLIQLGVPEAAIAESWHGKENPAVPTPDGTREPRNRRVEIVL